MYFITTKRMLEVCFFQHTPTFIIEPKEKRGGMVPGERYRLLLFTRKWDRFQVTAWAIENHALSCGCQVCQNKKT